MILKGHVMESKIEKKHDPKGHIIEIEEKRQSSSKKRDPEGHVTEREENSFKIEKKQCDPEGHIIEREERRQSSYTDTPLLASSKICS